MPAATIGQVSAAVLLLASIASASGTGVLTGTVRDALTRNPLIGASVVVAGTELTARTDQSGRYTIPQIPETAWAATASYVFRSGPEVCAPFTESSKPFRAAGGCTTRLDFHLFGAEAPPLDHSAEPHLRQMLNPDTLRADTIVWFQSGHDDSARLRCNMVKLGLLGNQRVGRSARAAVMFPYPSPSGAYKWVVTYRGACFLHFADPNSWGMFVRGEPEYFEVESLDVGFFSEMGDGAFEYVKCRAPYPADKWLVLKLNLPGRAAVYF